MCPSIVPEACLFVFPRRAFMSRGRHVCPEAARSLLKTWIQEGAYPLSTQRAKFRPRLSSPKNSMAQVSASALEFRTRRGTSLKRKCTPQGPYGPMPRVLRCFWGVGRFLVNEVPLYCSDLRTRPRKEGCVWARRRIRVIRSIIRHCLP